MISVLTQMGTLIACGVAWRIIRPGGLDADRVRSILSGLSFHLFLPALVLSVLWGSPLGLESLRIATFGAALIFFGAAATWLLTRGWRVDSRRLGAALLAAAFGNVTYLGLPVLETTYGDAAGAVAIQIDLFASMPLVLTFGVLIARHYGVAPAGEAAAWRSLAFNPPLWAAVLSLGLNRSGWAKPALVESVLASLCAPVVPLMLIALGLALDWRSWNLSNLPLAALVLGVKLFATPTFGLQLAAALGFHGQTLGALVLEAAMPSMVLGVVLCDRYRLDSRFYAMVVSLGTASAFVTLPFWHGRSVAATSWSLP